MSSQEIETVGEVRKINKSLYVLIPKNLALELNITEGTRFRVLRDRKNKPLQIIFDFAKSNQ